MNIYVLITLGVVIVFGLIAIIYLKFIDKSKDQTIGGLLFSSGLGLITSSFPTVIDTLTDLVKGFINNSAISNSSNVNFVSLTSGFVLIVLGIYCNKNIKDRFYVLNILSKDRRLINEYKNIKDLKISDFKLRENLIDIVRIFNDANNVTDKSSRYISDEIEEKTTAFINQSTDFKKGFTGMGPIPYTILAGTYLSATEIDEYFEYNRSKGAYYALHKKKWYKKSANYNELSIHDVNPSEQISDVVVAISITRKVEDRDLKQFTGLSIVRIGLNNPKDNAIIYIKQLYDYSQEIIDKMEDLKVKYPNLSTIHLVGAIPSCLSIELGRRISLNRSRLPKIISYHYKYNSDPKYSFGIIVSEDNKGKLVKT